MEMPGLSTEDVVQLIRASEHSIAVIATLDADAPSSLLKMAAQLEGMVTKPVQVSTLIDAIAKVRGTVPLKIERRPLVA
jgi:CheY-like chemotaxis protein